MGSQGRIQDWVDRLRRGDARSWDRLRGFVDGCVCRFSAGLDSSEREEITCDTLSLVWETLGRLRDHTKLLAVVRTITRRACSRRARSAQRRRALAFEPEDPLVEATKAPEAQELYEVLVGSLEETDRQLFHLLYIDGSYRAELDRAVGSEYAALRKRKHLLHKRLRAALERYSAEESDWNGRIQDL